jgi:hypothetical protein
VSDRFAADDEDVRRTSGGRKLVALAVLAVGCFATPSVAKHEPAPNQAPPGQTQTPPGQAKKQADQQQVAAQPAPAPAAAPAPPTKQQAKAQRKAAKHGGSTQLQTGRQAQTSTTTTTAQPTKQQQKAAQKSAGSHAQSQTTSSLPPGQAKKVETAPAAPVATPAQATPTTPTVTSSGSFTAAKTHHKARKRKHKPAAARRASSSNSAPQVATISQSPVSSANPANKTKAKKSSGGGNVPHFKPAAPSKTEQPNVVFRTVRDAVEVIPTAIWILLGLLTFLAALFAVTSARQTRRARRLAAEAGTLLGDVGVLQEAVLPVVPPRVGALALSVAHRPAGGPAAGGDFYDVIPLDGERTALVVGDVTGHGSGALGQATLVRFTLRAHLETGAGPRDALAIATDSLAPHFDEGFATAAVAIHDPQAGTLTYATAAHEAPIVVGPGEHHPVLVASSPPLGIGAGPSARRQTTVPFPEGSLACMLTDGALEARVRGELVGRARVEEWVRELGTRPAAGDMAELIRSRAAVSDDLAVCFATSTAGEDSGNWRVEELYRPSADEAARFLDACGASAEHKRAACEALRFSREGTVLCVRFEDDAVVSAEVLRNGSPTHVAA